MCMSRACLGKTIIVLHMELRKESGISLASYPSGGIGWPFLVSKLCVPCVQ
jgi:hypothetical protein